ncbi:hypothetical protein JCM8547_002684 [Rhodosporidiobolus lusitaniae]
MPPNHGNPSQSGRHSPYNGAILPPFHPRFGLEHTPFLYRNPAFIAEHNRQITQGAANQHRAREKQAERAEREERERQQETERKRREEGERKWWEWWNGLSKREKREWEEHWEEEERREEQDAFDKKLADLTMNDQRKERALDKRPIVRHFRPTYSLSCN